MNTPPPLEVLTSLRLEMQLGRSVANSLEVVLWERDDLFSKELKNWLQRILAGQASSQIMKSMNELARSPGRRSLLLILEKGIQGSPIDGALSELEKEFYLLAEHCFEQNLQLLPVKLLIPLALFILPGVMLLLIGPLLYSISIF